MDPATLSRHMKDLLPGLLGIEWLALDSERVRARFQVETRLCTMPGVLHGGAVMAFADTLGAVATVLNLEPGHTTTTIESKTNFLAAGRGGETIEGECTPLHRGRRTMVWQTRVTSGERMLALVTQTQAVLEPARAPGEVMAGLFAGRTPAEQQTLLAELERAGASFYRALAEGTADGETRAALLAAAAREEENAAVLERLVGGA